MKIKIISLGCAKNEVDSEYLAALLKQGGHQLVEKIEQGEAVLVNTCGFIQSAKEEALDVILELAQLKKQGKIQKIFAAGCLIERYLPELQEELAEVDVFLPFASYPQINAALKNKPLVTGREGFLPTASMTRQPLSAKPYAYLKISEGCNNHCTYCAIPLIRGQLRSRPTEDILAEAKALAAAGIKELIILGQDTTNYGLDLYGKQRLVPLLRDLQKLRIFPWIRLMYAHPAHLNDELIDLMAAENVLLPYLDLPLQHINDRILRRMNRHINRKQIIKLFERLRSRIPGLVLRTTFIVGFPGETDQEFQELLAFIQETRFERLGVFTFSAEEATPAYRFRSKIAEEVKIERWEKLMQAQQPLAAAYQQSLVGKTLAALVEGKNPKGNEYFGRSYIDAPEVDGLIEIKGRALSVGDIVKVKVVSASVYDLKGDHVA